ncbi:hypothetical protein PR048_029010 [Dryococelus australis]|uniref:Mutator-like transposase domain-containing protein n=1 Tax=Dryococelus australis TaxID=614101 RepID=A0ABQ9GFQ7_9NEOP|nr:hypothetical protein PR048_029010 [Dryococelus australis]
MWGQYFPWRVIRSFIAAEVTAHPCAASRRGRLAALDTAALRYWLLCTVCSPLEENRVDCWKLLTHSDFESIVWFVAQGHEVSEKFRGDTALEAFRRNPTVGSFAPSYWYTALLRYYYGTPVQSLARSGDGALDLRGNVAYIAPRYVGLGGIRSKNYARRITLNRPTHNIPSASFAVTEKMIVENGLKGRRSGATPECKSRGKRDIPSGIVRHDSHLRKSRSDPAGDLTRFWWEASNLTSQPSWSQSGIESAMAWCEESYQQSHGVISGTNKKPKSGWPELESNPYPPECDSSCFTFSLGPERVVQLVAFHKGVEPSSILGGIAPGLTHVGYAVDVAVRGFLWALLFLLPLHSSVTPSSHVCLKCARDPEGWSPTTSMISPLPSIRAGADRSSDAPSSYPFFPNHSSHHQPRKCTKLPVSSVVIVVICESPGTQINIHVVQSFSTIVVNTRKSPLILEGRRIVGIGYLWKQLNVVDKHVPFDCSLKDMVPISGGKKKKKKEGLNSGILFQCQLCSMKYSIWTNANNTTEMDLNTAAVSGTISTGGGLFQLEEIMSTMNIPCMTSNTFENLEQKGEIAAQAELELAAKE